MKSISKIYFKYILYYNINKLSYIFMFLYIKQNYIIIKNYFSLEYIRNNSILIYSILKNLIFLIIIINYNKSFIQNESFNYLPHFHIFVFHQSKSN